MANLPTYIAKGTFASGTTSISPGIPAGITNEDFLVLIVHTANQAVTAPAGWTEAPDSPQSTGTASTAGGVRLTTYYKGVGGVETAPTVAVSGGTATAGIIMAFRGVDLQAPFDVTAGSAAAANTAMTWPTDTTTVANTLVLLATAVDTDAASTATVGAVTAASLTGITEIHDQTVTTGTGGGVHAAYGNKATAGALGSMTATGSTSVTHAYMTMALKAAEPIVQTVGQYLNDLETPLKSGGSTTDGVSNNIYLQAEYDSGIRTMATTPKAEVDQTGTSFNGTPSSTLRAMEQIGSNTTRNLRGSSLVYDSINKRYIQFGGYDGTTRYNEVWVRYCDKPGQPWRRISPSGTPPTGKNLHGATVVTGNLTSGGAVRSYMVVWGGANPSDVNEMHTLRIDTPGSEAWATVTQTSAPSARSYMNGQVVATPGPSSDQNYVYVYGGWAASRENALYRCTFDVDAPTAVTWTTLKANGAGGNPTQTTGAVMAYKASTSKLYLYGGYTGSAMVNTFWEYDIAGNTWTNTSPSGTAPTAAECGAGGYDAANNRFWFTGGWTTNGTFSTSTNHIGYISDVGGSEAYVNVRLTESLTGNQHYAGHSFSGFCVNPDLGHLQLKSMATVDSNERYGYIIDFNEGVTSEFPVYGETEGEYLNARDAMASIWNPDYDEWLSIGGFDDMSDDATITTGTHSGDVWVYNKSENSWRYANKGFKGLPPLEGSYGAYDTKRDRVIIFGGLTGVAGLSNEVWSLVRDEFGNYEAIPLRPSGTKPAERWLGAAVYDETNDRMIFALGGDASGPINDVWELSFTGSAQGAWTQRSPTGSVTAVTGMGFAHRIGSTHLYIFAGATNSALSTVVGNFYYLDFSTTNCAWNTITQSGQTSRRTPGMVHDTDQARMVVFGGFNGSAVINTTSYFQLSGSTWSNAAPATIPDARRSLIAQYIDKKIYIHGGRPNTGTWYRNTWELTPNYGTPNSSTWANKYPHTYTPVYHTFTGGTLSNSYHWQAWTTEGSIDSPKVSHYSQTQFDSYYFDGNIGLTDPNSNWTNDTYATDNINTTSATSAADSTTSSNYLYIKGTNVAASSPETRAISSVQVKLFGAIDSETDTLATIYTESLGESLGTTNGYSFSGVDVAWKTLTTPTGGWTMEKVRKLEAKVHGAGAPAKPIVSRVEVRIFFTTNSESVADFTLSSGTPQYTKTHTTDAMKHTLGTKTHTVDSVLRDNKHYTKEQNASLPTVATPRAEAFYPTDYTAVSSDNSTYVDETGEPYLLFYFERYHTNSTDQISATWNGKSTEAPTSRTVYLQIWNKTSTSWETLDSNSAAAANTDFTLTGGKTTSLSNYWDTGNKVVFRVYQ